MKLLFSYNEKRELFRVNSLIYRRDFFTKYYPHIELALPKGVSLDTKTSEKDMETIKKELNPELAGTLKKQIENFYNKNQQTIDSFFKRKGLKLPEELIVIFTQYGSGSGYSSPNYIVLNMFMKKTSTDFIHELIHLPVEKAYVEKFKLSQYEKEQVVDWLMITDSEIRKLAPERTFHCGEPSEELLKRIGLR